MRAPFSSIASLLIKNLCITSSVAKDRGLWQGVRGTTRGEFKIDTYNPIKTAYELLWTEVRNPERSNLAIQNTLRRILDNYFIILGNIDRDAIYAKFKAKGSGLAMPHFDSYGFFTGGKTGGRVQEGKISCGKCCIARPDPKAAMVPIW
ncbi:MAG: AAA family ATPase [Actinomycetia bacterium]|nr:AAA family ATPase [Actinomycetes bacterium]